MKLKIDKACDLSSISVLPPQARRQNVASNGTQVSQHRSQPSQQSFSQSMFSQFSQNSVDEVLTNDQNKEQDGMKASLDGGFKYISEQVSEDICEHKLKEIFLVLSALPEKIEASILKSQSEQCNSFMKEIKTMASHLVTGNVKDQTSIVLPKVRDTSHGASQQGKPCPNQNSAVPPKVFVQATIAPKIETGGWKAVKKEKVNFTNTISGKMQKQKGCPSFKQESECRIIIDSDNYSDGGFSCLLEERTSGTTNYFYEDLKDETERILRKARRRKYRNTVIIS